MLEKGKHNFHKRNIYAIINEKKCNEVKIYGACNPQQPDFCAGKR